MPEDDEGPSDDLSRDQILAYLESRSDELPPTDPLSGDGAVQLYLVFINLLDDDVRDRVPRFRDPLTGERLKGRSYDNHLLLAEIVRVAETLGQPPTSTEFDEHGAFSLNPYTDRFGSFPRAVEAAGYEPRFTTGQQKLKYLGERQELVDPDELDSF